MSKELTPLKALDHIKTYARLDACKRCQYFKNGNCENNIGECIWKDEINIIENALKGLERVRQVCLKHDIVDTNELDKVLRQFKELKQDYAMLKEQHDLLVNEQCDKFKALEIIIVKKVNVRAFKKVLLMKQDDDVKLKCFNSQTDAYQEDLTKDEFVFLKGIIK